jgi:hypothetical protein
VKTPSWAWRFEFVALGAVTSVKGDGRLSEGGIGIHNSNKANENAQTDNRPVLSAFLVAAEAAKRAAFRGLRD